MLHVPTLCDLYLCELLNKLLHVLSACLHVNSIYWDIIIPMALAVTIRKMPLVMALNVQSILKSGDNIYADSAKCLQSILGSADSQSYDSGAQYMCTQCHAIWPTPNKCPEFNNNAS